MTTNSTSQSRVVDETAPLLGDQSSILPEEVQDHSAFNGDEDADVGYNRGQVLLLSVCALADPLSFFCIVPFVPQMIFELGGIKESKVGFYAGLIESLFSIVQMFTMFFWGRASDRYGRKRILTISFGGLVIFSSLFGFSQSLWQMIAFRCAAGIFSGSVVAIRSMIGENSTSKSQAAAFAWFSFFRNLGIFGGTLIGGLAKPSEQFGGVFKGVWFFERFPYALPTLCCGVLVLIVFIISIVWVEETLHISQSRSAASEQPMSVRELITYPGIPNVLFVWSIVALLGFSFTAVMPVFFWTPIELGGYGLPPSKISLLIMLGGVSQAVWTLLVFPKLHKRVGTGGLLRLTAVVWPIAFALNPLANLVLRKGLLTVFLVFAPIVVILGSGCSMAFTAVQLAVNDISPSHSTLGTLNGIALSLSSGVRAFAPGTFTSLLAVGVDHQILGGHLIWVVMIGVTLVYGASLYWFPKKAETAPR